MNGRALVALLVATLFGVSAAGAATSAVEPPANVAPPAVAGAAVDGTRVVARNSSWSGTTPLAHAYQWRRCDGGGGACSDIAGAIGQSYLLSTADVGATVRVAETVTNDAGSATATSDASSVVAAAPPVNTAAPSVSGLAQDGQRLSISRGGWSGTVPIAYTFQWRRCDAHGACTDVAGATGTSYLLGSEDIGSTIRVAVSAANVAGTAASVTDATAVVAAAAPAGTGRPSISGSAREAQVLTATHGSWTGSQAIAYEYQWQRCDASATICVDIAGATGPSYVPTAADVGSTIRVVVTARNAVGAASATSDATGVVTARPAPVSSPPVGGGGSSGGGSSASGPPDLVVLASLMPQPHAVGDAFTYAFTVTNRSSQGASAATLTVTLPANVAFVAARSDRGPGCGANGHEITCFLDFFPARLTDVVYVDAKVTATGDGAGIARIDSTPTDADLTNNTASLAMRVRETALGTAGPKAADGPSVHAYPSRGRAGARVPLRFRISDGGKALRLEITIRRSRRRLAMFRLPARRYETDTDAFVTWASPKTARGSFRYCVVASEKLGTVTRTSCAALVLK